MPLYQKKNLQSVFLKIKLVTVVLILAKENQTTLPMLYLVIVHTLELSQIHVIGGRINIISILI